MEEKINIAEILKDKQKGIRLYSPIFGNCTFCYVKDESSDICVRRPYNEMNYFNFDGIYHTGGECLLFPSNEMRDWSKFAWQKGDLLINSCGFQCIFKEWSSDDYTKFNGCYSNSRDGYEDVLNAKTANFVKLDNNTTYEYVREIERKLGGKFNLKTLEIEKPKFKDGDIVVAEEDNYYDRVIFIAAIKDDIVSKALINVRYEDYEVNYNEYRFGHNRNLRLATDSEKQQLFDALTKEGKYWDAEKKQVVDLKEHQFKPFEKVLVRDSYYDMWRASFFSHIKEDDGRYVTTCFTWKFCIPYEGNEHLLGITNNVEE